MQGLVANGSTGFAEISLVAVAYADALLKALEQDNGIASNTGN